MRSGPLSSRNGAPSSSGTSRRSGSGCGGSTSHTGACDDRAPPSGVHRARRRPAARGQRARIDLPQRAAALRTVIAQAQGAGTWCRPRRACRRSTRRVRPRARPAPVANNSPLGAAGAMSSLRRRSSSAGARARCARGVRAAAASGARVATAPPAPARSRCRAAGPRAAGATSCCSVSVKRAAASACCAASQATSRAGNAGADAAPARRCRRN